ncbi:MAG TPA: LysR substrate-binding domain-containing protein [Terriglobales bacterium]|nr:LysR substrate-binding domain-containing protein [Terriglobales bacterium]
MTDNRRRLSTVPLGALRAFEAAARHNSFKTAAAELAVTPAAISHQIKALEEHLGLILFERLNRGLRLTAGGARLAETAGDAFARLERVLDELEATGQMAGAATLTISAAPTIAAKWLVPRLHRFQAAYPAIDLRLQAGDALADLTGSAGVDVALRYGPGDYGSELHAEKLWPYGEIVAVCAPALLVKGPLEEAADVLQHSLLRVAVPATRQRISKDAADLGGWPAWLAAAGVMALDAARTVALGPLFGTSQLALEAAVMGRGLALVPRMVVTDDIAAGRLVQPFPVGIPDIFAYWLVYAAARADEARIRAFARWIREEVLTATESVSA